MGYLAVPLIFHQQTTLPYLLVDSLRLRKESSGDIHNLGVSSFGRAILSWLGMNVNKNMIRNLSLTPENIAESSAKVIAAYPTPQNP